MFVDISCVQLFLTEDYERVSLEQGACPFCRTKLDELH